MLGLNLALIGGMSGGGTHQESGLLRRLAHKSHTKHMVLHAHIPVMAMHGLADKLYSDEFVRQKV